MRFVGVLRECVVSRSMGYFVQRNFLYVRGNDVQLWPSDSRVLSQASCSSTDALAEASQDGFPARVGVVLDVDHRTSAIVDRSHSTSRRTDSVSFLTCMGCVSLVFVHVRHHVSAVHLLDLSFRTVAKTLVSQLPQERASRASDNDRDYQTANFRQITTNVINLGVFSSTMNHQ